MNNEQLKQYQEVYEHLYFGGERITLHNHRVWEVKLKDGQENKTFYDLEDLQNANLDKGVCIVLVAYLLRVEGNRVIRFHPITDSELNFLWKQVEILRASESHLIEIVKQAQHEHDSDIESSDKAYILTQARNRLASLKRA